MLPATPQKDYGVFRLLRRLFLMLLTQRYYLFDAMLPMMTAASNKAYFAPAAVLQDVSYAFLAIERC